MHAVLSGAKAQGLAPDVSCFNALFWQLTLEGRPNEDFADIFDQMTHRAISPDEVQMSPISNATLTLSWGLHKLAFVCLPSPVNAPTLAAALSHHRCETVGVGDAQNPQQHGRQGGPAQAHRSAPAAAQRTVRRHCCLQILGRAT